ncbi:MAG: AMP-binding protein [Anaerolineales bacterium]|nr:AMP-binding protein [Anaerolineales bacterium]
MNLFDRFEQNTHNHPDKPAYIYFDKGLWKTLTYKDVLDKTQRFLRGLEAERYTPGMTAALLTPPSADFFPFALALLKLGIVPILVEPALGIKKIREIYAESKPDIFVGNTLTHTLRLIFGWGRESVKYNLSIAGMESGKPALSNAKVWKPNLQSPIPNYHLPLTTPAAIIYTSGSTGLPKGAIYTQENLAAQLELLKNTFNIAPDEVDLPAFPLYALIDLLLGVTSVIPDISFPIPGKTDAAKVIGAIQKFNVTNMFASPVVLDLLSSFAENNNSSSHPIVLSSLKRIITAGAPATIDLQKRFRHLLADHTSLYGIYGATETLPIAKVESREVFALEEKTKNGAGIFLGKPIEGVTVRIIPITDEPIEEWRDSLTVKPNVVGEITVQSGATTREYLNRPTSNRISKIFRHREEGALPDEAISKIASGYHPRNDEKVDIIHRMGDVGYFDEEGRLWYCGRKSHRVQTKDDVLFTEQIENIFNAHPQVYRTALVGVDREPVLWVELEKGVKTDKEKIIADLKTLAAAHPQASRIRIFLFLKKFPTDVRHNSKIIREKLTELATAY